jgi:hypothetical protein
MLARTLVDPASMHELDPLSWTGLLAIAHAERLSATLAHVLIDHAISAAAVPANLPAPARARLDAAILNAQAAQTRALWEVEMARRALASLNIPVVLLKGSAYAVAGLRAGRGRHIGDLDILVPREALPDVEGALLGAGWEWVKADAYDDAYYRRWMHELPPLIHRERDAMIDVHHTILPLTARPKPDAAALIADSVALPNGLRILSPEDRVIHAAAHLFADGELDGGLRNLWDIRCLLEGVDRPTLMQRAAHHGLVNATARACRLSDAVYAQDEGGLSLPDRLFRRRILARDGWGRGTRPVARAGFYVRSHLIRMPLPMLAHHLWMKWRVAPR